MATISSSPSCVEFLKLVRKSGLVTPQELDERFPTEEDLPATPHEVASSLVAANLITHYQARQLLAGKYRGFVLGPYKILNPIGQGGMGTVFLAKHAELQRKVAIKVFPAEKAQEKLALDRFFREARSAAALDHQNIVRIYDISQGNGVYFLIMEYVDGNDLHSLMSKTGPLHFAQAAHYVAQAAAGLDHAHRKGFVHRDIKPANLMLAKDGVVKILDLGLARSLVNDQDNLTALNNEESAVAGTVDFISPEQALGGLVDERSDIYNLGATLFALLTGHPPFGGTTSQKLMQHQFKDTQMLAGKLKGKVPATLIDVVLKMMEKKPSDRYQTAEDVIDALGPWLPAPTSGNIVRDPVSSTDFQTSGTLNTRKSDVKPPTPAIDRQQIAKWGGIAAACLVALIGLLSLFRGSGKPTESYTQAPVSDLPAKPNSNAEPRNPNPAPSTVSSRSQSLAIAPYRVDFAELPPTKHKIEHPGRWVREASIGKVSLPKGVFVNHWWGDASAEYSVGDLAGGRGIGLEQTDGGSGVQYDFDFDDRLSNLNPEDKVIIRLTYAFHRGENGLAFVEHVHSRQRFSSVELPFTNGQWKTIEIPFTRPPGSDSYKFVVRPSSNDDKNALSVGTVWVKSIEMIDARNRN